MGAVTCENHGPGTKGKAVAVSIGFTLKPQALGGVLVVCQCGMPHPDFE
jgi:hypothetical protein